MAAEALGLQGVELLAHGAKRSLTRVPAEEALAGKAAIGIYFSAHWCPPCRAFTPVLADLYRQLKARGVAFEVVFVSGDRDAAQAASYFADMPWLAVPYENEVLRQQLKQRFKVAGIPTLAMLDGATGELLAADARSAVMADRETGEQFPWQSAAAPPQGLLSLLASPRNLTLLFAVLYYLHKWLVQS